MSGSSLYLSFPDRASFEREHGANWIHGRAFVSGAKGFELFSPCMLVLRHPEHGEELEIACEVVMVQAEGPFAGVALQFRERGERMRASLASFIASGQANVPADEESEADLDFADDSLDEGVEAGGSAREQNDELPAAKGGAPQPAKPRLSLSQERRERIRNLPAAARIKVAHGAVLEDRVLLERTYGSSVWELLLSNPRITIPEVAAMARKGTLPRPLVELIANNEAWMRQAVIRRALLANPRLAMESATKILRCLSARELKLVPQQTAFPATVRQAAQRLLRGG